MTMNADTERAQEIRHECLLQLYGSKELPLPIVHIHKVCKRQGFNYSSLEIREALFFLCEQEMVKRFPDEATGEVRYRITGKGMIHYENSQ